MKYDDLTREEQIVLEAFIKIIKDNGLIYLFNFLDHPHGEGTIYIYKKDDNWVRCFYERGEEHDHKEYDNLYRLCIDIFELLEKKNRDYCLKNFTQYINNEVSNRRRK